LLRTLQDDSDAVWRTNVQALLDLTPGIPLGLYECPVPYHRLLSADTLAWCASTKRFRFHKVPQVAWFGVRV
jgi:4-hydroxy-tetrahydrodipicolinate synthase